MTLQSSGPISTADINVELGRSPTAQISFDEPEVRALAGVPSGPISTSDFYGKSNGVVAEPGTMSVSASYNGTFTATYTNLDPTKRVYITTYYSETRGAVNLGGYNGGWFWPHASGNGTYHGTYDMYPPDAYRYAVKCSGTDEQGTTKSSKNTAS